MIFAYSFHFALLKTIRDSWSVLGFLTFTPQIYLWTVWHWGGPYVNHCSIFPQASACCILQLRFMPQCLHHAMLVLLGRWVLISHFLLNRFRQGVNLKRSTVVSWEFPVALRALTVSHTSTLRTDFPSGALCEISCDACVKFVLDTFCWFSPCGAFR